jgi:hypothetical protein
MQQMTLQMKPLNQWIKITLSLFIAAVQVACSKSEPVVWVNLERAQQLVGQPDRVQIQQNSVHKFVPSQSEFLQQVEPSHVTQRETDKKRLQALAVVEAEKNRLLNGLTKAYETELRSAVAIFASNLESGRRLKAKKLSEETINKISDIVKQNALQHGLLIAELAQLVGWPDSANLIVKPYGNDPMAIQKLTETVDELRETITTISSKTTDQIDKILLEETSLNKEERLQIKAQIETAYKEATVEAGRLAKKKLDTIAAFSFFDVLEETSGILRMQPARHMTLPRMSVAFGNAPDRRPPKIPKSVLEGRLNIWLRLHGYKLSDGAQNAPDLTGEFVTWMRIK